MVVLRLAILVTLFCGAETVHILDMSSSIPDRGKQMIPSKCQSSCSEQSRIAQEYKLRDTDNWNFKPQLIAPDYIVFIVAVWSAAVAMTAYHPWYMLWWPPDRQKRCAVYRT